MSLKATVANRAVWEGLYATGHSVLRYPNDLFVTLVARRLDPAVQRSVLDFGCGSGSNLIHLAAAGFECAAVDTSPSALEIAGRRLEERGLGAQLHLMTDRLPYGDASFDAVVAWQVLYYNDADGVTRALGEIERVLRPNGKLLATFIRANDMLLETARPIGPSTYVTGARPSSQAGAVVFVPQDREQLARLFTGYACVEIGHFEWNLGQTSSHWLVWAEKTGAGAA
jgi:SAM-dependent methyltransferase